MGLRVRTKKKGAEWVWEKSRREEDRIGKAVIKAS